VFRLFDDSESGYISLNNLQRVARELGEALTEVRACLFVLLCAYLGMSMEVLVCLALTPLDHAYEEATRNGFATPFCSVAISVELFFIRCSLRDHVQQDELREMIERADLDGDGKISPDEFINIMTKKTFQ